MPPQPPTLLVANVFDRVNLNTAATLSASSEATGHEVRYAADYRRERTWWQTATTAANHYVRSDLGAGNTAAVDCCFLDRGHNLYGMTVAVQGGDDGVTWVTTPISRAVPAAGTVGGDPATTWAVTEEGALYAFSALSSARRYWRVIVTDSHQPVLTGVIVGARTQLLGFSTVWDTDAGTRVQRSETSDSGWRATGRTTSYRRVEIGLQSVGSAEYDGTMRYLRRTLFERDQPWVHIQDYGTYPERAWMFQVEGAGWDLPKSRATHAGRIAGREVGISY